MLLAAMIGPAAANAQPSLRSDDAFTAIFFAYGKSGLADASGGNDPRSPSGTACIDSLFQGMLSGKNSNAYTAGSLANDHIEIIGYADPIGNAAANFILARKRADAVRDYMITQGIAAGRIVIVSKGSVSPLQNWHCAGMPSRQTLAACLWADRRVEIRLFRYSKPNG
jgi:hypothetical protein